MLKRSGKSKGKAVKWNQWKKNEEANRFEKCIEQGTLKVLLSYFYEILDEFLKHSYVKRSQAECFEKDNEEVKKSNGKIALLHVDFTENVCCKACDIFFIIIVGVSLTFNRILMPHSVI